MSTCNCIVEVPGCLVRQGGGEHAPAGGRVEQKGWTGSSSLFLVRGQGGSKPWGGVCWVAKERRVLLLLRAEQWKPRGGWRGGLLSCHPSYGTEDCE